MSDIDIGNISREQVTAALEISLAVGEAIRDGGPIPSGELYARLMGHLTLSQYESIIRTLIRCRMVKQSGFMLSWVGPAKDSKCTCSTLPQQECPDHGIAASNARQNEYWKRVGGHD